MMDIEPQDDELWAPINMYRTSMMQSETDVTVPTKTPGTGRGRRGKRKKEEGDISMTTLMSLLCDWSS